MKRFILIFLSVATVIITPVAQTLTFKLSNPHISYSGGTNRLVYDIMVMGNPDGTFLYSSTIRFSKENVFNTTVNPVFTKSCIAGQYNGYEKYDVTTSWTGNSFYIYINPHYAGINPSAAYCAINSGWQCLGTVEIRISNPAGTAGISFRTLSTTASYSIGSAPGYALYTLAYDPCNFNDLYLQRIFSGISGWSQTGGIVNWGVAVNTSVFDTVSAAVLTGTTPGTECFCSNLTIHEQGRVKIDVGHPLTITGDLIIRNNQGLWIESSSSGTGSLITEGDITYENGGSVVVERYLTGDCWHYISSPVENALSGVFMDDYLRSWLEPLNAWSEWIVPIDVPLNVNEGYEVWKEGTPGTKYFTGSVNTGFQFVGLGYTADPGGGGWNFIGNPYPCSQDVGSNADPADWWLWPGNVDHVIYYLTSANETTYQYDTYSWGTGLGTGSATRYIPAMQSYFVKTSAASFLMFNDDTRVHNNSPFFKNEEVPENTLRIKTNGGALSDDIIISFRDGFSEGFDNDFDAYKLSNSSSVPSVYSITPDQMMLDQDVRSFSGKSTLVPVGFLPGYQGIYTIEGLLTESFFTDIEIKLEDLLEKNVIDLRTQPLYQFSAAPGDDPARFVLHFINNPNGTGDMDKEAMMIYAAGSNIFVKSDVNSGNEGTIAVFDMMGRKVFEGTLQDRQINRFSPSVSSGFYAVMVTSEKGTFSDKVWLSE